ncbi:MAG: hypothetical protein LLG09_02035 [Negativicutes bacterium]|nr:hypothetical protein [Negativicutes bacterium]
MKINKVNLAWFSPTQTRNKIPHAVARAFPAKVSGYELTLLLQTAQLHCFAAEELLVSGMPIERRQEIAKYLQ